MTESINLLPTLENPLKTIGQKVWIEGRSLICKYAILYYGFLGEKRTPVENITTVSWKEPDSVLAGFMEIDIFGERPPHPSASPNVQHQNRFIYDTKDLEQWRALKDWIEQNCRGSNSDDGQSSVADELGKLAKLLDAGLLTREEFEAQKAKLLG